MDGAGTHSSDDAKEYDRQRDAYLAALGLRTIRFTAYDVTYHTNAVVEAILYAARETVLTNDPDKQWRYASSLLLGDSIYFGVEQQSASISNITIEETEEEVYHLDVTPATFILTEVCTIHAFDFTYH